MIRINLLLVFFCLVHLDVEDGDPRGGGVQQRQEQRLHEPRYIAPRHALLRPASAYGTHGATRAPETKDHLDCAEIHRGFAVPAAHEVTA